MSQENIGSKRRNNTVYAYLDKSTIALYGFLYIISFAKILSIQEFGVFILADSIRIWGISFCDLSVGQALIHYGAGKSKKDFWQIAFNSFILKLILFAIISSAIFLFTPLVPKLFGENNLIKLIKLVPFLILSVLLYNTPVQILNAKEHIRKIFHIDLILLIVFSLGIVLAGKYGLITTAYNAMLLLMIVRFIAILSGFLYIRDFYLKSALIIDAKLIKDLLVYSKASFANSLGVFIFSKTDIFMLGAMLNPSYVALYSSAAVLIRLYTLLNEPMNMIVLPAISKLKSTNSPNLNVMAGNIYRKTSLLAFTISIPISALLLIFPQEIMHLFYGNKYVNNIELVRLFAIWGLILPFYRSAASIINGIGKPEINAKYTWLAALVNILLNIPLIYYLKTIGAALASIITALMLLLIFTFTLQKLFQISIFGPLVIRAQQGSQK